MEVTQYHGGEHSDLRGKVRFFNDFDLTDIKRTYEIFPICDHPRGWQAHRVERKWFYCKAGEIMVNLIKLDNFSKPSPDLKAEAYNLNAYKPVILAVPGGYATAFLATQPNSNLMIYSDFSLEKSKEDDYRFPLGTWKTSWK